MAYNSNPNQNQNKSSQPAGQTPAQSWEEHDLNQQTSNLNVSGRNFQPSAQSFQPSQGGFTPAFNPNAQNYGGYSSNNNSQGYPNQYSQPYGYGQQEGNNQYNQYNQYSQQQAYASHAYSQETQTYDPTARKKAPIPSMPVAKGPAKVLSLGGGPPKTLSLGSPKTVSIGTKTPPAKAVSAKTADTSSAVKPTAIVPEKNVLKATEAPIDSKKEIGDITPATAPVAASTTAAASVAAKIEKAAEKRQENIIKAQAAEAKQQEEELDNELLAEVYGKEHVSIVFIGHVDAGKSTLGGQLLILTGMVDQRTVDKFRREAAEMGRESWVYSWALDSTKQERSKGITVEVGRAHFETEKRAYSILDAPGHKSFVPNMIGGASQADVGVLVISARSGEYEAGFEKGGQTREHAILAKTQGVNKLIVVINKMDDSTVAWSKARYDECTTKLATFLRREAGYNPKTDVVFMPVSAFTGAGLKERVSPDDCPWYTGPSLIEYLDSMQSFERKINAPLMMPISTKWKDLGTILEGKIESGHVKKGTKVLMMPGDRQLEVTTIYNETEEEVDGALCGEQVRIKVKGVEEEDVLNGFVLTSLRTPVHTVTSFEAQIVIIELQSLLTAGFSCVMHVHTAIEEVSFTALLHKLDKTNRKSKAAPPFAKQGMKIVARLETTQPVCLERFSDYAQLGRFTLRDSGVTIAIGKVTKLIG